MQNENQSTSTAYFAGGCFWGVERYFQGIKGVAATQVGYAQSTVSNPSYEQVCSGSTDAVESVRVDYDPQVVSLKVLSMLFMDVINPYTLNQQGNDVGRQYRSAMIYTSPEQKDVFDSIMERFNQRSQRPTVVSVEELKSFYKAEEYHQDYLDKNPGGYCHIPLAKIANVAERQKYIERVWALSPEQYAVTQEADTEEPFHNEYDKVYEPGIYVDIVSGEPLFVSSTKYDAGCGWPSFSKPIDSSKLEYKQDLRVPGRPRIEVRVKESGIHLGHVFDDGPTQMGGKRYCMNSASLRFVPRDRMEAEGYGRYLDLVK